MILRQLFDPESSTYTYVLGDEVSKRALVVDPVRERVEEILTTLRELGLTLAASLETHIHADHVSAGSALRDTTQAQVVLHAQANDCGCADRIIEEGDEITTGSLTLRAIHTPGHTPDSVSWYAERKRLVFTGDALLIGTCGRTDFQGGDPGALYDSITTKLFALPDDVVVYPAHDYQGRTQSTIGAEKKTNARVSGRSRAEFIDLMNNLKLPPPKKIAVAVPANRACGVEPHGV
jgi:glyoxylase-like metal-dependent hydrolase (beta-lactamase superfamily II)